LEKAPPPPLQNSNRLALDLCSHDTRRIRNLELRRIPNVERSTFFPKEGCVS
jgi:hypothetical protein